MISNKHNELDRKISEMCSRHSIDISTLPVLALGQASAGSPRSNERATEFMRRLQEAKSTKQNQLTSFLNESHSIDQAWEKQIADGRARIGQLKGASESKRSQLKAIETRRAQIESSARSNELSLGSDSNLSELLQTAQDELKSSRSPRLMPCFTSFVFSQ
jgi:chromosome segregation ATPase